MNRKPIVVLYLGLFCFFFPIEKEKKEKTKKMHTCKRSTFLCISMPTFFTKHQIACSPMCYDCFLCHQGFDTEYPRSVCSTTNRKKEKEKQKNERENNQSRIVLFFRASFLKQTPQTTHFIIYRTVHSFVALPSTPPFLLEISHLLGLTGFRKH